MLKEHAVDLGADDGRRPASDPQATRGNSGAAAFGLGHLVTPWSIGGHR
jgi:hypothetical protein